MQALEHELGGQLLQRSSTGVRPTAGGYALATKMAALLASYDSTMIEVRHLVRGETEQLRIGYLASAFGEYLAPALEKLRQVHPRTKLKLLDLFPGEQINALRRGEIDIALTQEIGDLLGRDLYARQLAVTESIVALPASHPLALQKQAKIAELKSETFVTGTEDRVPGYRRRLRQICRSCGKFRPRLIDNSEDLSSKLAMVANEDAVALLPAYMRHQTAPGLSLSRLPTREQPGDCLSSGSGGKPPPAAHSPGLASRRTIPPLRRPETVISCGVNPMATCTHVTVPKKVFIGRISPNEKVL